MENNIIPNQSEDKDETEMEHNHVSEDLNSRVVESHEINDAERDIIKGDTVGQTLYSAKWILNTLISLSNVIWKYEKYNHNPFYFLCTS